MHPRRADAEANFFAWLQKLATTYLPTLSGECFGVEGLKKKLVKFFVLFYVYRNVLMLGCFLYSFSFLYVCSPHHTIQAFFFFFQAQGGSFALYTLGIFGLDILALTAQQHIDHCNIRTVSLYRLGSGNAARCSALRANSYEALLQAPHSTLPDHHHPHQHQHHLITNNTQQHSATATLLIRPRFVYLSGMSPTSVSYSPDHHCNCQERNHRGGVQPPWPLPFYIFQVQ